MIWIEGGRGIRNRCEDLNFFFKKKKLEIYIYYILFDLIEIKILYLFRKI